MVTNNITVKNEQGLHMRPAGILVGEMGKFKSNVRITFNGNEFDGKSIMNVMAACIKCGSEITVTCDGEDEQAAMDKFIELADNNFGDEK